MDAREKLEKEIADLEKRLEKDHFGGLINKDQRRKNENRLNKLRKELEKLNNEKK